MNRSRKPQSTFHEVENQLYAEFVDKCKKAQKVSSKWYCWIKAQNIFHQKQVENPEKWGNVTFKGSYGWMRQFIMQCNGLCEFISFQMCIAIIGVF
jgi:hypothetical protein